MRTEGELYIQVSHTNPYYSRLALLLYLILKLKRLCNGPNHNLIFSVIQAYLYPFYSHCVFEFVSCSIRRLKTPIFQHYYFWVLQVLLLILVVLVTSTRLNMIFCPKLQIPISSQFFFQFQLFHFPFPLDLLTHILHFLFFLELFFSFNS